MKNCFFLLSVLFLFASTNSNAQSNNTRMQQNSSDRWVPMAREAGISEADIAIWRTLTPEQRQERLQNIPTDQKQKVRQSHQQRRIDRGFFANKNIRMSRDLKVSDTERKEWESLTPEQRKEKFRSLSPDQKRKIYQARQSRHVKPANNPRWANYSPANRMKKAEMDAIKQMTPEQRKAHFENMPPEQRQLMKEARQHRGERQGSWERKAKALGMTNAEMQAFKNMTPEQRKAYFENLSPEQKAKIKEMHRQHKGQRGAKSSLQNGQQKPGNWCGTPPPKN